jgi:Na+-driven multidrug efflux pump
VGIYFAWERDYFIRVNAFKRDSLLADIVNHIICYLVEIPAAYILSQALGLYGVWLAYPVAFMVALTGQHLYYHKFWKRKTHQRFFDKPEETRT